MTDLIAKLEAATEGSRELSDEVLLALGWEQGQDDHWFAPDNEVPVRGAYRPSPTEYVDDGMALVPDHFEAMARRAPGEYRSTAYVDIPKDLYGSRANTPALALSAAILRMNMEEGR